MAEARVLNRERILARIRAMPPAVSEAAAKAGKVQVDELVAALKRAAPVSALDEHPGDLRDHIEVYQNDQRVISFRIIAAARDSKGRYYGRYVEFGHTAADGKFVPAQPFWFATYRAWKRGMIRQVRAAVRARLKAEFPEFAK
jgi:hypothetical protein